jgi:hypothetical protein
MNRQVLQMGVHPQAKEQAQSANNEAAHKQRTSGDAAEKGDLIKIRKDQVGFATGMTHWFGRLTEGAHGE